ncbi:MAG: hypothetical protein ACRBEQ_13220 [Hyphomonas sp.]
MTRVLILTSLGALIALAALLWGLTYLWQGLGVDVSGHGWTAYILGGVLTIVLSCGLFALTFASSRRGHDEAVIKHEKSSEK